MNLNKERFQFDQVRGADITEIMAIEGVSFPFPWTKGMFLNELSNAPSSISYAIRDLRHRKIIGYMFTKALLDELHLLNIAVDPQWRGKGLGRALIALVLNTALKKGMERVILEVRVSNRPALHLYKKFGFKQVCIRRNYYCSPTENALLLQYDVDRSKATRARVTVSK